MKNKILGVGVFTAGKYASSEVVGVNKYAPTWQYNLWHSMLYRCYSPSKNRGSYAGCEVSEKFLDFQNFMLWAETQEGFGKSGFQLDKDILARDNKIYAPEYCVFLPREINTLLVQCQRKTRRFPLGVSFEIWSGRYKAQISKDKKTINLGRYSTIEEAFCAYKISKESYIKQQATKWKDQIDPRAYHALMTYEVLITD